MFVYLSKETNNQTNKTMLKIEIPFKKLLQEPFTHETETHPRNEDGCGYTWHTFFVDGIKVYTHKQYHNFGYPNTFINFEATVETAMKLHDSGVWEMNEYTYRALTKKQVV